MSIDQTQDYIFGLEGSQQQVCQFLHDLIISYPEITCKIRYKIPFYYCKSWICYLNPKKNKAIELVFLRGNELSNIQEILRHNGRKQVAGITFFKPEDHPVEAIHEIICEALVLDNSIPYASKRMKKQNMGKK